MRDLNKTQTTVIYADDLTYINDKYPGRTNQERIGNLVDMHQKLLKAEMSRPAEVTANILKRLGTDPKLIDKLLEPI